MHAVLHAEFGEPPAGMEDQRDHGGADAVKDCRHRFEVAERDVERAERGDDDEVRQDEGPAARPRAPETRAQVGDVDPDLDRQRTGQRLADRDGLAHLLLGEPAAAADEFALHLCDKRHRASEADRPEAQEVAHDFADAARRGGDRSLAHGRATGLRGLWETQSWRSATASRAQRNSAS